MVRGSLGGAVLVSIYSFVLVVLAHLTARRLRTSGRPPGRGERQPEPDQGNLFRGAGLALCIAALLLPLARLIGTRELGDVLILLGTMAAVGMAMIPLVRASTEGRSDPGSVGAGTGDVRLADSSRSRQSTRRKGPGAARERTAQPDRTAGALPSDPTAAGTTSSPHGHGAPESDAAPPDQTTTDPERVTPARRASATLNDVDHVVAEYAHRLGLGSADTLPTPVRPDHPAGLPQRRGPETDDGSKP